MPRASLFDPANALVTWEEARETSEMTGLKPTELATFRAERHALHQVLIRVTVETHVPDGPNYADLGISLRSMAETILETEVAPELPAIQGEFDALRARSREVIERELDARIFDAPPPPPTPGFFEKLFGKAEMPAPVKSRDERALEASAYWSATAGKEGDTLKGSCFAALARTADAVLGHRGALVVPRDILASIATNFVSNDRGGALVSARVAPLFDRAAEWGGFPLSYLYLFGVWLLLVILAAVAVERGGR